MNVKEMHIEINQSLQKVAANKTRKYLSEELDLVLNKIQKRFIQSKLKPRNGGGFTIEQLQLDSIRILLVNKTIKAFIDESYPHRYEVFLPTNYSYLIADAAMVKEKCGETFTPITIDTYITWLTQAFTTKQTAPYYESLKLTVNTYELLVPQNLPLNNAYKPQQRKEDLSTISPYLIHRTNQTLDIQNTQVGFEKYANRYKPQAFAIISEFSQPLATFTADGTTLTQTSSEVLNRKQYDVQGTLVANSLESSELIPNLLTTAFHGPTSRAPISELTGDVLYIYGSESFIVSKCHITYIRKPQPISLALGSDCELPEEFHSTICDLAVEYIKGKLEGSPQSSEKDIETRIIL